MEALKTFCLWMTIALLSPLWLPLLLLRYLAFAYMTVFDKIMECEL